MKVTGKVWVVLEYLPNTESKLLGTYATEDDAIYACLEIDDNSISPMNKYYWEEREILTRFDERKFVTK